MSSCGSCSSSCCPSSPGAGCFASPLLVDEAGTTRTPRYVVQEVLGHGSYGVVCAATDAVTGERVAIKRIANIFDNTAEALRVLREIKLLRMLAHPGESHPCNQAHHTLWRSSRDCLQPCTLSKPWLLP